MILATYAPHHPTEGLHHASTALTGADGIALGVFLVVVLVILGTVLLRWGKA